MNSTLPRLYTDLADWFHLLTDPAEYAEEATFYRLLFEQALGAPPRTLLELGSGGGNMALHYKRYVRSTLVDPAPGMLAISRVLNPECEHIQGDMRTLRLHRNFDVVFVHDAVCYMLTEDDLSAALATAYAHLEQGGVALFAPDNVRENFAESTDHGGHDGSGRSLRYLEWTHDPDPADTTYLVDYAYLLREDGREVRCEHDQHVEGLFGRDDWLRLLRAAGFQAEVSPLVHSDVTPGAVDVFVCKKLSG